MPASERSEEGSGPSLLTDAVAPPEAEIVASTTELSPARRRGDAIDDSTFDGLMLAHGDAIYSLCLRVLGDPAQAADVQQQVFIQAHRDFARFEGRSKRKTWLFSIALNRCKDAIKAERRRSQRIQADDATVVAFADPAAGPDTQLAKARQLVDLERCLESLSSDSRLVVVARFLVGMSFEEMGRALNAKPDTLQTRVTRALPLLKRCMGRKGWANE